MPSISSAELSSRLATGIIRQIVPVSTARSFALSDNNKYIRTQASAINLTVPSCSDVAFPVGSFLEVRQAAAGQVTIVAGSGVSINAKTSGSLQTYGPGSSITLLKVDNDTWDIKGDVSAH